MRQEGRYMYKTKRLVSADVCGAPLLVAFFVRFRLLLAGQKSLLTACVYSIRSLYICINIHITRNSQNLSALFLCFFFFIESHHPDGRLSRKKKKEKRVTYF